MEIPQNTQIDNRKDELIKKVLKTFETDSCFSLGHATRVCHFQSQERSERNLLKRVITPK